ncbi:hypothetical protein Asi03nite_27880 [Actinoplanes siamensis]|uniref:LPXTG-motif cell wall anchor domain-containing protein n=2 Tax=Actinoplanes siamensis TaxID=1223317 RepID=A0A919N6H6_9ACTN|nr:hypothetical protein [Actinoplanes siamensis]GIF05250.1 hypothetical protein Asi03nite_27880 [Actinoplanes siamensis]
MRLRALLSRLVLPPAAAAIATAGLALPAHADSIADFPMVLLNITDTVTVIDGQSKTVKFDVLNLGSADAGDVVIGFASRAGLGFVPPAGCSATACEIEKLSAGERRHLSFTVRPSAGASLTSYLDVTASVAGEESDDMRVTVVRTTRAGVDLETGDLPDLKLDRGQSADLPVRVVNTGNATSGRLAMAVIAEGGLEPLLAYRNCERDDAPELSAVICVFDQTLAPGASYTLPAATPAKIEVGADTPGPADYYASVVAVGLTDDYLKAFSKRAASARGAELELTPAAGAGDDEFADDDLNPDDNVSEFMVAVGRSDADSKAIGATFRGAPGESVTVRVGTQNLGPTATVRAGLKWMGYVHVNVPAGVELTEVDEWCLPGTSPSRLDLDAGLDSADWVCPLLDQLPNGEKRLFSFSGMVRDGAHQAGFVRVDGGAQDTVHGNDKATLDVVADAGESLPITGPSAGLIAGGGAALLVAGALALRMARRRPIVTVAG